MKEIWKDVAGYEGRYKVSNKGRVKSLISGKILKNQSDKYGYQYVKLSNGKRGSYKHMSIHRLVALAFIPNPENKPEVNHKDGNKRNNYVDNLEWVTPKENVEHAYRNNLRNNDTLIANGMKNAKEIYQIDKDGNILNVWKSAKEASRVLGFDQTAILRCCKLEKYKTYKGYKWRFKDNLHEEFKTKGRKSKPVAITDLETGEIIKKFNSAKDLSNYLSVNRNSVYRVLNGNKKSIKGYGVIYIEGSG